MLLSADGVFYMSIATTCICSLMEGELQPAHLLPTLLLWLSPSNLYHNGDGVGRSLNHLFFWDSFLYLYFLSFSFVDDQLLWVRRGTRVR
jgi:hypothetical protein